MASIKKTNIYSYLKSKFSNTASHIKMNGTQSAGSSDLIARADHVHPTDTSRAPSDHDHDGRYIKDAAGTVTSTQLSSNSVITTKINDEAVTNEKISSVSADKIIYTEQLTTSHNLNDLTATGRYYGSGTVMSSLTNGLITAGGILEVIRYGTSAGIVSQRFIATNSNQAYNKIYYRARHTNVSINDGWLDWQIISVDGHTHTKSEISDFPTSMTPTSHSHGSITNAGAIGSASGKIITTTTNGVLQASNSITKSQISDFPTSMTPTKHDSEETTYGLGSATKFGHCKVINNLNQTSHVGGQVLSAYQGKVLSDKIDENKTTVSDSLTDTSTTNALSANKGNVLSDNVAILAFRSSNSTGGGVFTAPDSLTMSKNGYLYLSVTNANGNALSGTLLIDFNNGANIYTRTLSSGMASLQITSTGTFLIRVFYHNNGLFKGSMMGKVTVS